MPATEPSNVKTILTLVAVAIIIAIVVTVIQSLILGKANVAITGGVVGAMIVSLALAAKRKRST